MPHCLAEIHEVYASSAFFRSITNTARAFTIRMLPGVVEACCKRRSPSRATAARSSSASAKDNVALIRKRDGAFTYTTTDLATIQYRLEHFQPDAVLYVVDFRQSQHFANLFEAARRWGVAGIELTHISFGSVLGKDGRPISTRKGDGTELIDLLDKAVDLGRCDDLRKPRGPPGPGA